MQYCDGFSYSGNNETVARVTLKGVGKDLPLYFRGVRNLQATLAYLTTHAGLGSATHVLLSGDSAGGLATYWHADFLGAALPNASVAAAPDSGYFLGDTSNPAWPATLRWIAEQGNATGGAGLDASCAAAAVAAGKTAAEACTLPEDVAAHVDVPLFVMNSKYDPALDSISGKLHGDADVERLGQSLVSHVNATVLKGKPRNAAFLTSCHEHCGQWGANQTISYKSKNWDDFFVDIDGFTGLTAINSWWQEMSMSGGSSQHSPLWMQAATFPCKACCSGGQA